MSALSKPRYTPQQYLDLERVADYKSEYFSGEILAMAGGSENHSLIAVNISGELRNRLKSKDCRVFSSDMRVQIAETGAYVYPDVSVVCGEARFAGPSHDLLLNSSVIFVVLSHSTEANDRGLKFAHYRRLESLTNYILVSQDQAQIEHYVRQSDGTWNLSEVEGLSGVLHLSSIGCELPLSKSLPESISPRRCFYRKMMPTITVLEPIEGIAMSALSKPRYTPQQYLDLERVADYKSEYFSGEILAMAGASLQHNRITINLGAILQNELGGKSCEPFTTDLRVKGRHTGAYFYPDAVVGCSPLEFEDSSKDILLNPVVIIEVLSPSTEANDRGLKFAHYRLIESLTDYVLISQEKVQIEHYVRQVDDTWVLTFLDSISGVLHLSSISCELPLAEIYARVEFAPKLSLQEDDADNHRA